MAVAAVFVALVLWFDRVWIPSQQQYLNERNLRTLRTISAQVKARIDNFDQAIDHAIDSFRFEDQADRDPLNRYVKLYAKELEILEVNPEAGGDLVVRPANPPHVRVQRDDGRSYLYVGYRHKIEHQKNFELIARSDVDQVVADYLTRSDFDAILLAESSGAVIAQRSSSGLELASVARMCERGQPAASCTAQANAFTRLKGTSDLATVTIGASDYVLYTQPVPLSMTHEGDKSDNSHEEWTLCGFVRLDRFRAASSTIPTTYWLAFGMALALILFAMPLVKLHILSPRERLHRADAVWASGATFMIVALVAFAVLDLHAFGMVMPAGVDEQLRGVAEAIAGHFKAEVEAIDRQMTAFEQDDVWLEALGYKQETKERTLASVRANLETVAEMTIRLGKKGRPQCKLPWSCRDGVLARLGVEYPFFKLVGWTDTDGWQRVKWSTSAVVTPFINVRDAKLPYFDQMKLGRRTTDRDSAPTTGIVVLTSPNTSEKLTVFWKALPAVEKDTQRPDLLGETLATVPVSLTRPVLPKNVQFAVVDRNGLVLFHSDPARTLTENFFQESEESPKLKAMTAAHESGAMSARYLGRPHRFYVTPLKVAPFADQRWSLITFEDRAVVETANLETLNLAASMFGLYAVVLGALWALSVWLMPDSFTKWLWPHAEKASRYRIAAVTATAGGFACLGALALLTSTVALSVVLVLVAAALMVTFTILRGEGSARPASWPADFFHARAALLFLLAAVPAIVCFRLAFAFETELHVTRGRSHLAAELQRRELQARLDTQRVPICGDDDQGAEPCQRVRDRITFQTRNTLWDVNLPAREPAQGAAVEAALAPTALAAFLRAVYRPYNEIAADLLMTSRLPDSADLERWHVAVDPRLPVNGTLLVIAVVLIAIAYAVVSYLLEPLFVLDVAVPARLVAAAGDDDDTSLLIVGPTGTGRTARLQRNSRVMVFDVRSLSFVDSPAGVATISSIRISAADGGAPDIDQQDEHELDWASTILAISGQPFQIVAIDHLECRLHDQAFRTKMLECLETAIYKQSATIWCSAVREPLELVEELNAPISERRRWARLFEGFRRESVGLAGDSHAAEAFRATLDGRTDLPLTLRRRIDSECTAAPQLLRIGRMLVARLPKSSTSSEVDVLAEIASEAQGFYEELWDGCATGEKVLLRQLAEEGLVNPNSSSTAARLVRAGLIRQDAAFQVMNETFRRFILDAASHDEISTWEREGVRVPWGTIATTGVTVAFGLAGLLLLTQEQLVDAWISYVPALAPAIPTVWKVVSAVQSVQGGQALKAVRPEVTA